MAAEGVGPTPSEYIRHHLTHLTNQKQGFIVDFSVWNIDSIVFSTDLDSLDGGLTWTRTDDNEIVGKDGSTTIVTLTLGVVGNVATVTATLANNYDSHPGLNVDDLQALGSVTVVATDTPAVLCDKTMVEQVLLNLARNAMQAMDDPALPTRILDIRVRRAASNQHSGWIEFAVTDLGSGIPQDVAERLFTPFFTTRPEGMGLGLSMCRTVIEQHGGFLGFAPHEPRGTVFTFTLPAATP